MRVFNVRIKGGSYTKDLPLLLLDAQILGCTECFPDHSTQLVQIPAVNPSAALSLYIF